MLKLIPKKDRNQHACCCCASKPVKYFVTTHDHIKDEHDLPYCSKCAALLIVKESKDRRYIDAQKLKDAMNIEDDTNGNFNIMTALQCVDDAPTADVQEVKHGKWVVCGMFDDFVKCSCCGYQDTRNHVIYENLMYCGKCGAKMDEEEA